MGKHLPYEEIAEFFDFPKLHPHQRAFATTRAQFPLTMGAPGSGKSIALIVRALYLSTETPYFGNLNGNVGLIGRLVRTHLKRTTMRDFFEFIDPKWVAHWDKQDYILRLINGSEIYFVPLEDKMSFASMNLGWAAFEQVEEVPEDVFEEISIRRMRRVLTLHKTSLCFRSAFAVANNCGNWVFDLWGLNEQKKDSKNLGEQKKYDPDYPVYHSSVYDNQEHLPPTYIPNMLKKYRGDKKKVELLVNGGWGTMEGSTYFAFSDSLVLGTDEWPPLNEETHIGVDHGETESATSFISMVVRPAEFNPGRWHVHVYDEVYVERPSIWESIKEFDESLQFQTLMRGRASGLPFPEEARLRVAKFSCDPAMQRAMVKENENSPEQTIADVYMLRAKERGLNMGLIPSLNGIFVGLDRMNWLMSSGLMTINPRCVHFIQECKNCVNGPDGKPKKSSVDHSVAAVRYGIMGMPSAYIFPKDEGERLTTVERIRLKQRSVTKRDFVEMGAYIV